MSEFPRRDTNWWGWGAPGGPAPLDQDARAVLQGEVGDLETWDRPEAIEDLTLPPPQPLPHSIAAAVGGEWVLTDAEDRVRHAHGQGYADLTRIRTDQLESAPDAVVLPPDAGSLHAILAICAEEDIAVVPFGGGTSVVGGVAPLRGTHTRLISLDLCRLREVSIDRHSLTATLGAGLRGPEAEALLIDQGLTIGHFPQSFEYATIGGFAATRSAGQASSGYGRFDSLVSSVRMVSPAGALSTLETTHTAAGPSLREVIIGSEGVFGVIPDVTVRVRPTPTVKRYEAWMAESLASGTETVRTLAQQGNLPDIIRISDEQETRVSMTLSGPRGLKKSALDRYLKARRHAAGSLVIVGFEGNHESVARRRSLAVRELRAGGAIYLGKSAGRSWEHGRYGGPYFRDTLMEMGAMVETLETSHSWTHLNDLHRAVTSAIEGALRDQGTPGLVFCHLSHAYPDGACLYFTFISKARRGAEIEQWAAVKRAASEAITTAGATITHHHGVGRDHAPYMEAEVGRLGVDVLRSIKDRLDPSGIMNPEKLIG